MDHNYLKYRELKPNDTVLILGAYDGDFIREKKDEIIEKNVFVINVEPDIRLCKDMMEFILKEMPLNATALNIAVSDRTGTAVFENKQNTFISGLKDIPFMYWTDKALFETKILTIALDDLIKLYDPTCIFCDIEGAEIEAFTNSAYFAFIPYIAIAAYHIRDGVKTFVRLSEYFSKKILNSHKIIVDVDDFKKQEEVLYIV